MVGLGVDIAGRLFYRTLSRYLFARAGFADLADALEAAAADLGGDTPASAHAALQRVGLR
jgi:Zn-dependent metalloprotease